MTETATSPDTAAHDDHGHEGHASSLGLSNMKLAFWLFLGSECLLFGALISTYLLSKANFIGQVVAGNPEVTSTMPANFIEEFAAEQSVVDRRVGQGDGVALARRREAPTVQDDQRHGASSWVGDGCGGHR